MSECTQLIQAAEAKAYYGLAVNYKALEALVRVLTEDSSISGTSLSTLMEDNSIQSFPDEFTEGFSFDDNGILQYPGAPGTEVCRLTCARPVQYEIKFIEPSEIIHGPVRRGESCGQACGKRLGHQDRFALEQA